jgi:cell division protein FtsL
MRPLRLLNVALLAAIVVTVGITYDLKHKAEVADDHVAHLRADIAAEKDKIHTLNAEWAALNQPSRLEAVVKEHADYFQLQSFSPDQVGTVGEIPLRASATAAASADAGPGSPASDAAVKATLARIAAGGALRER